MIRPLPVYSIVIALFIALFFSILVSPQAIGQVIGLESSSKTEGPITMEADKVTYDQKGHFTILEGGVRIVSKNTTIQADKVTYYDETKDAVAEGRVVLTEGEDILRCDRLELNMETKKGVVYEAKLFLKKKNFHINGSKAEKLGESEYRVYDATLTSCDAKVPEWEFTAKRLDVEVGGYGEGWWPGFRILDIPVLYFPWSIFPVKTDRQSGFLFPAFSYDSRWGPELTIPYYWAIAPNQDATFYLDRIGDERGRGFKEGLEYRYAWSQQASGQINANYIWDQVGDQSLAWKERPDKSRWSIFAEHDQSFDGGYYFKTNINWVSDPNYPSDFTSDIPGRLSIDASSANQLESTITAGKNWGWGALETDAYYFRDLTIPDNSATMQMLPQTTFNLYQGRFLDTPIFYEMESQGTNFWREDGIRGGRIDLYPRLSVPLKPYDLVRFEPWIGYRETVYFPQDDPLGIYKDVTSRALYDAGASLATTFSRIIPFQWGDIRGLKHIIEPEVIYNYIPSVNQGGNADFTNGINHNVIQPDDPHFNDWADRIPGQNAVTWMLTNYLIGKVVGADGKVTYPEYLYLKLYQGYDFSPDFSYSSGSHLSDFMAEARSTPFTWLSGTMDLQYNLRYNRLDVFNAGVGFSDKRGDHLSVNYLTTRDQVGAIDTQLTIRIIKPLDFYFDYRYDLLDKVPIQTTYGLDYRRQCWEVSLRVYDNSSYSELVNGVLTPQPKEWKFQVLFTLTGLGQYRF